MIRFLDSLRGQLVLLTIGALILAQAISLWLFMDERGLAVRAALGAEAAGRAANVARLLEEAPPELQSSIQKAADSPLVRFRIGQQPSVNHLNHVDEGSVEARMRALLGPKDTREIRVELHEAKGALSPMAHQPPNDDELHLEMFQDGLSTIEMALSVALQDGNWLNVDTRFQRPPLQWPVITTLSFGITATIILIAVFWFMLNRLTGPLRRVTTAAERFGRGETNDTLPLTGPQEVRELTLTYNRMQERLVRNMADRTRMLAALGHDLRSPLTALRVHVEMVEEETLRISLVSSIEEMQEMVETTLAFARGMVTSEASQIVHMHAFLERLHQDMLGAFEIVAGDDYAVRIRPNMLRRALRNLIENSLRYGGNAVVSVERAAGSFLIRIEDDGPGIPDAELDRVFEPFFRLEKSRSRNTGGTGLGLAIARTMVRAHGGDVLLENRKGQGLCATIYIPFDGGVT